MTEAVALAVSAVGVLLQAIANGRTKAKDDRSTARGLLALHHKIADWENAATVTNFYLERWIGRIKEADPDARRAVVEAPPIDFERAIEGQRRVLEKVPQREYGGGDIVSLLEIYAPDTADRFDEAMIARANLLQDLPNEVLRTYEAKGRGAP